MQRVKNLNGRSEMLTKANRFRQLLADGKIPVGHMLYEFNTRGMAWMLQEAGVDFAMIDMEHGPFSLGDVADLTAWFGATTVAPLVRIPEVQYHFIARALDAGVLGVMAPNVESAEQARELVEAAKYSPLGKRRLYFGGPAGNYYPVPVEKFQPYMDECNSNTSVICMIESPIGMENLEQIAATPGVDALWVGYADLSAAMGIAGEFHHAYFIAAMKRVVEVAHKHNLAAAIQPGSPEQLREWLDMGFNAISYGADSYTYKDALSQAIADVRKTIGE